jgi:hypothetical protein
MTSLRMGTGRKTNSDGTREARRSARKVGLHPARPRGGSQSGSVVLTASNRGDPTPHASHLCVPASVQHGNRAGTRYIPVQQSATASALGEAKRVVDKRGLQ